MRQFKQFKHILCVTVVALALVVTAFVSADVNAATITQKATVNVKNATISVGNSDSIIGITNLKINGKKYTKGSIKKKVKTVRYAYNPTGILNEGTDTVYLNSSIEEKFVPDTEDYAQSLDNDKYIATASYRFTFLKPGTYKISFDVYNNGETKTEYNKDGLTKTTSYELEKTHYVYTYKVLQTTNELKKISLGKNKITYTTKSAGTKVSTKTVTNYRFLKGNKGKLSFKTSNKNYKITSAFVTTFDANGKIVITPAGNNKTITYGTGKRLDETIVNKIVQDANGEDTYTTDPVTGEKTYTTQPVVTARSQDKYKKTTVYYGYRDVFTGSYTTYTISNRTVYVPRENELGEWYDLKNPDGTDVKDADGKIMRACDAVNATVITKKYPQRTTVDGAYKTVEVVYEKVVLPDATSLDDRTTYYLDAGCNRQSYTSGGYNLVSKDGVARNIMKADGYTYSNPVYNRKFYSATYKGSWQVAANIWDSSGSYYADRDANGNYTTYYKWVDDYSTGKRVEIVDLNQVSVGGMSDSYTFNKK